MEKSCSTLSSSWPQNAEITLQVTAFEEHHLRSCLGAENNIATIYNKSFSKRLSKITIKACDFGINMKVSVETTDRLYLIIVSLQKHIFTSKLH